MTCGVDKLPWPGNPVGGVRGRKTVFGRVWLSWEACVGARGVGCKNDQIYVAKKWCWVAQKPQKWGLGPPGGTQNASKGRFYCFALCAQQFSAKSGGLRRGQGGGVKKRPKFMLPKSGAELPRTPKNGVWDPWEAPKMRKKAKFAVLHCVHSPLYSGAILGKTCQLRAISCTGAPGRYAS